MFSLSGKKQTVLVVDDEIKILEVVKSFLEADGYRVFTAKTGELALKLMDSSNLNLIILDIMLPDIDGIEICKIIRKKSKLPIIMLTARVDDEDLVKCLDLGADDYVTKPFSPRALVGRVRAVLRRYSDESLIVADILNFSNGNLEINCVSHQVCLNGEPVNLTPVEFKILQSVAKSPNKVFTRDELIMAAYGYDYEGNDRSIDTHIKNLRHKIESDPKTPCYILTVHGVGYKFGGE